MSSKTKMSSPSQPGAQDPSNLFATPPRRTTFEMSPREMSKWTFQTPGDQLETKLHGLTMPVVGRGPGSGRSRSWHGIQRRKAENPETEGKPKKEQQEPYLKLLDHPRLTGKEKYLGGVLGDDGYFEAIFSCFFTFFEL